MIHRPVRFEIERPVDFRLTDVRSAPRQQGRTMNISSGGVLIATGQKIGVGRKVEIFVRMAKLSPESMEVDLRLLGMTVRSGDGWVAVQVKKHQILPRAGQQEAASAPISPIPINSPGIDPGTDNTHGKSEGPEA